MKPRTVLESVAALSADVLEPEPDRPALAIQNRSQRACESCDMSRCMCASQDTPTSQTIGIGE
jgi:predicted metal-binding protein